MKTHKIGIAVEAVPCRVARHFRHGKKQRGKRIYVGQIVQLYEDEPPEQLYSTHARSKRGLIHLLNRAIIRFHSTRHPVFISWI